jgi:hypothetical protein
MKYIKINKQTHEDLMNKFKSYLENARLTGDSIDFKTSLIPARPDLPKAHLYITAEAYVKILLYVRDTSTEIAWHGTVKRNKNIFLIKDVMLYPQTLAALTVTTDQENYNEWLCGLDDDTHNHLRFQGHSHVNLAVSPSGTDLQYYNDILQVLPNDEYYIFMIINKSGDMTLLIYDLAENIIYENADIIFHVTNEKDEIDILDTIDNEKTEYCTRPVSSYANSVFSYPSYDQDFEDFRTGKLDSYTPKKVAAKTTTTYRNVNLKKKGKY